MGYERFDKVWSVIRAMLPNKSRGVARVCSQRHLLGIAVGGAPWRDLPDIYGPSRAPSKRPRASAG